MIKKYYICDVKSNIFHMKQILNLLLILSIIAFVACNRRTKAEMSDSFYKAVSYIEKDPQKAANFLDVMSADTLNMKSASRLYYWLYKTYADDEAHHGTIPLQRAELLLEAYGRMGVDSLYVLSLYLKGGAYRDIGDIPQAAEYYVRTIDEAKRCKLKNNAVTLRSYVQLAKCYEQTQMYQSAVNVLLEAEKQIPYGKNVIDELLANNYKELHQYQTATSYLEKLYKQKGLSAQKRNEIVTELLPLYILLKDEAKVRLYEPLLLNINEEALSVDKVVVLNEAKALLYEYKQDTNSAMSYWHKVLQSEQLVQSQNAAKHLLQLSIKKNDARNGMNYAKLYQELTDSVMQHIELQQMGKASSTYNYQLQQRKAMVAERKSKQTMFVAFLICGAMLMMVVILALWFIQNKLHHQKEISAKQIIIDNMQETTMSLQAELQQLHDNDYQQATAYFPNLKQRLLDVDGEMPTQLWGMLVQAVDVIFPQLSVNIKRLWPEVPDRQRKMLYLLCIGIPSKHISVLLNTSPQNVFGHKKRIVQRLSGSETPSAHDEKQIFYKLRGEMAN